MKKKQIVILMTDSTRCDMLGCYGNKDMKTPFLDKLAEEGIRFDRAYTCQPVCGPARSALFTGLFPSSNGCIANGLSILQGVKTVGERLQEQNIATAYIGKWHLDGGDYFGWGECPMGWDPDYWYDMRCYLDELTPEERKKSRDVFSSYNEGGIDESFTFAHRCTDRAIDFIEKHREEDFLLVVSYDEPHEPALCPEPFASMYIDYDFPKNENVFDTLEDKPQYQKYWKAENASTQDMENITMKWPQFLGANAFCDYEFGRVIDTIDTLIPQALVIYTSDHGEAFNSHGLWAKGNVIYEEAARVPFIVRNGQDGNSTRVYKNPVSHISLVPTILEYMDIPIPLRLQGDSILSVIEDTSKKVSDAVFLEFTRYETNHDGFGGFQPMRAIITERYKLAIHLLDKDELYDNLIDPNEMHNQINNPDYAKIRNQLHDQLLKNMDDRMDPYRGYHWLFRPWRKDIDSSMPLWKVPGRESVPPEIDRPNTRRYDTGQEVILDRIRQKRGKGGLVS